MKDTRHNQLVEWLAKAGWQTHGWVETVSQRLRARTWHLGVEAEDLIESLRERVRSRPDAFRFVIEGPRQGWHSPVLVIEACEVVITHRLSAEKLAGYADFWLACDNTDCIHFRLMQMNEHGDMTEVRRIVAGCASVA